MSYLGRSAKLSRKTQEKTSFLATAGQTVATGLSYVATFVEVHVNGILLTDTSDYTATNGNSITFTVALSLNDEVTVIALKTFVLADHYSKTESDAAHYTKAASDARFEPIDSAYTKAEADANLAALVDSSPAALNTLNELAAALGDDAAFSTTVTNSIATKAPIASPTFTGNATASGLIINSGASNQALLLDGSTGYNTAINFKNNNVHKWTVQALGDGSNAFRFYNYTTNTESLRIDSSGNVGIANSSPLAKLDIQGDTTSFTNMAKIYLTDVNSNANSRNWSIGNGGSAYGNLTFAVSAAADGNAGDGTAVNKLTIDSAGNTSVLTGNLVIGTSGKGIDFSATGGPNSGSTGTSELLDDYEEGTWTPTDVSGAGLTLTTHGAHYTKVGNLVHISLYVNYPSTSNSTASAIGGLPFTAKGGNSYSYISGRSATNGVAMTAQVNSSNSHMEPHDIVTDSRIPNNSIGTGGTHILLSGTYNAA